MDELLHHCLQELSFDGDLGCDVSRLKDFIFGFYSHSGVPQALDEPFCAFVWSLVAQQPTVRVGTVPPSVSSEVWVAPQTSAKRKAIAKGEEHVKTKPPELVLVPNAHLRPLDKLKEEYGDRLRIAVHPDAIYAAITGSHIRFARMSPMVYSALQIITKGRDDGVTVVQLGQQSGYDQKTCFYLVRQLTDLDLVVKVRRGGVGTHFVIHRYFFDRSPSWKAIRHEEYQAQGPEHPPLLRASPELPDEDDREPDIRALNFTPIDARHLSSLPLIRGRIIKLLRASRNQMHTSQNLLITLFNGKGFANPTKTDRRFFQSRIRELIQQRVIEKVVVPSSRKKTSGATVKCFRLIGDPSDRGEAIVVQPQDGEEDEKEIGDKSSVKMNITVHKQVFDLLEESGTTGMTLNDLSAALYQFDRRTIELLLTRAEKFSPSSHLSDLGIAGMMETSGRERRHRYFTVAAYHELLQKEKLDNSSPANSGVDLTDVGGFLPVSSNFFYEEQNILYRYQDSFKDSEKIQGPARKRLLKNPILPDGSVKQGRPRKYPLLTGEEQNSRKHNAKRKRAEIETQGVTPSDDQGEDDRCTKKRKETETVPKKRGRPRKVQMEVGTSVEESISSSSRKETQNPRRRDDAQWRLSQSEGPPLRQSPVAAQPSTRTEALVDPLGRVTSVYVLQTPESLREDPLPSNTLASTHSPVTAPPLEREASLTEFVTCDHVIPTGARLPSLSGSAPRIDVSRYAGAEPSDRTLTGNRVPIDPTLMDAPENIPTVQHPYDTFSVDSPLTLSDPAFDSIITPVPEMFNIAHPVHEFATENPTNRLTTKRTRESRVNVSHLRRENELFRVVQNMGGIANIQTKDLYDEHMAIIEAMTKAGEPTSGPVGTRTDKRTAVATFDALERRGRVKQLKTSIVSHTGIRRPACIVYLPHIGQESLNDFLAELARSSATPHAENFVKISEHIEYGANPTSVARGALPLQLLQMEEPGDDRKERWSRNTARAQQLFSYDESVVREVLLTERTTVAQLYGFIVGKAARARELHLSSLEAFEKNAPSPYIISRECRILDISFFCQDISLGLYCSLVSSLSHSEELTQFMSTESGRSTPVKDLPSSLNFALQIGRSRGRSRLLDLLETLRALKLATPLRTSTSEKPFITCTPIEGRPHTFDLASLDGWTVSTPMAAPTYWKFNDIAPIHIWAASEISPPFYEDVPLNSTENVMKYWRLLEQASLSPQGMIATDGVSTTGPPSAGVSIARSLRRNISWKSNYVLTWHQIQCMKQYVDTSTAMTPLEDESGIARLERICWVISAPRASVESYFITAREKLLKDMEKIRKKSEHPSEKPSKLSSSGKASLARKAAQARLQREQEWNDLIQRSHPMPMENATAAKVNRIRTRFLEATSVKAKDRWEVEIKQAVQEADLSMNKAASKRHFPARPIPVLVDVPLAVSALSGEKSVEALIASQGPPIARDREKMKRKSKKGGENTADASQGKTLRRHRFQWNRDYEELARDASVIIKARCRNLPRLDWAAFEQIFPAVPRNTVRQRLAHIRETPGNEAYLSRLEDRWHELWILHRGTPLLPDDDITSTSNFNLIKHVEFLRKHIDKNAVRVGFTQQREKPNGVLPPSVDELLSFYDLSENPPTAPPWDFVWNAAVEEGREKRMLRQPFVRITDDLPSSGTTLPESISLAEAAVKMTMGTPHERYEPESGAALLHSVGEHYVFPATKNLLHRGVLSKLVRDPQKQKPGRQLKISEGNQNAVAGPVPRDTYQDAAALEDISLQDGLWREWPLLATDGDSAVLVQFASEGKLEFMVDTTQAKIARPGLDWNSKKADDDQIETTIHIRIVSDLSSGRDTVASPDWEPTDLLVYNPATSVPVDHLPGHGLCFDGGPACCRHFTVTGPVDCTGCLEQEWSLFIESLTAEERDCARKVLDVVRDGGERGVSKDQIRTNALLERIKIPVWSLIEKMTGSSIPLLFWTGYSSIALVSSAFLRHWTVMVSDSPVVRVFPRRWTDISGSKVKDFWESALKAVIGVIIFRPGISQAELRWRLRFIYDRQELSDAVKWLREEGYLKPRCHPAIEDDTMNVGTLDNGEEKGLFWFIGDEKHWYQL